MNRAAQPLPGRASPSAIQAHTTAATTRLLCVHALNAYRRNRSLGLLTATDLSRVEGDT